MNRVTFMCYTIVLAILSATIHPHAVLAVDSTYTTGGTNFVLYYLGNNSHVADPWITDDESGSARHVLGAYDRNPNLVRSTLQAMCNTGQRKVGLVLSFYVYDPSWNLTDAQKQLTSQSSKNVPAAVLSVNGAPTQRLRTNIQNFIVMATNLPAKHLQHANHATWGPNRYAGIPNAYLKMTYRKIQFV